MAAASSAVDQDTIVKNINNLINFYDPPKDLHDAPGVTATNHKVELTEAMRGLFVGGTFPERWVAVGKKIGSTKTLDVIKEAIIANPTFDRVFRERELIIRSKHTSGHNPVPDGLCLAQDNGPVDIVSNAKLIITPGSIPDPAGKTKESAKNGLFTVSNIVDASNSLPKSFLDAINMGFILSVDINKIGANYQIIIKTENIGTITETFDGKTFLPDIKKTSPSFFAGNPKKNTEIGRLIQDYRDNKANKEENLKKIRSYLLCKELGDTLQVIWLNRIFNLPVKKTTTDGTNTPILRKNTVIGTTDEVVFYRSLVNNVGVIHTIDNGGKTHLYSPTEIRPEDAKALREQQIVLKQKDVIGQNMSVITNLEDIITSTRGDDSWIEKSTNWGKLAKDGKTLREHAINIIINLLTALKSYNDELNARFDALIVTSTIDDIDTAKRMAENERFREPFIDCKDQYYKIKSIKSIVYNNKIKFDPKKFTEISIESYDTGEVPSFSGGGSMSGGVIKPDILLKIQQQKRITEDDKKAYKMPENIGLILSANVPSEIGLGSLNKCFLYCFIREFMPELFTYAKFMKDGLNRAGVTEPTDNDDYIHILETKRLDYKWKEDDNKIDVGEYIENTNTGLMDYQELIPEETKNEFIDIAKNVLKYSHLFVNLFTNFKSLILEHFFDHVKFHIFNRVPNSFYKIDTIHGGINDEVILEHLNNVLRVEEGVQEAGGINEEQLDRAASIAIDSYDLYYESLIKSAYYHPKKESTLVVSTAVKSPVSKTQRATKAKVNTGVISRTRTYVRNSAGTPQRKTVRKVLFVNQEPMPGSGRRRTRRKGKTGSKTRRRA
jgi:hypothetical protein